MDMEYASIKILERWGIQLIDSDNNDLIFNEEKQHINFLKELNKEFPNHVPLKIDVVFPIMLSEVEQREINRIIYKESHGTVKHPAPIIQHLLCDLAEYRSTEGKNRILAKAWSSSLHPEKKIIPYIFATDYLHEVCISVHLLNLEIKQLNKIYDQVGISYNNIVQYFLQDLAGYRTMGNTKGQEALNWLHQLDF